MILADKIIQLRKQRNWSQEDLANKLSISRQSISKWESSTSLPDLDKIIKLSQIFEVSCDYLLKDEQATINTIETDPESNIRKVSLEDANELMDTYSHSAKRIGLGVVLCINSVVPLLFLGGLSETPAANISSDFAGGFGLILLFIGIGIAVSMFITNGMKLSKFDFYEKEKIQLLYGVEGLVTKRKDEFENTFRLFITMGVVICILSLIPLFISAMFSLPGIYNILGLCLMFIIASIGVYLLVYAGMIHSSFLRLLQLEEYSPKQKEILIQSKTTSDAFGGFYWCSITATYIGISLYTNAWYKTWIIWPVAALIFAALVNLIQMFKNKN